MGRYSRKCYERRSVAKIVYAAIKKCNNLSSQLLPLKPRYYLFSAVEAISSHKVSKQ